MIIVEENTTATIKMYLRDFSDEELIGDALLEQYDDRVTDDAGSVESLSCVSNALNRFDVHIISEDNRKAVSASVIGGAYDDFRKLFTFNLDTSTLNSESFYVIRVFDIISDKLLSQDKMYIMPSGASVSTYQPKLTTTERTMDNEFIVYGE